MEKLSDLDLDELMWDHDGSYWYSRDAYNITPADMHEYARKLKADNAALQLQVDELTLCAQGIVSKLGLDILITERTTALQRQVEELQKDVERLSELIDEADGWSGNLGA